MATTFEPDAAANERPLPDERLRDMLYLLKLARYVDERLEALYRQGRLPGALYSGRGQEGHARRRRLRAVGDRLAVPDASRPHGTADQGPRSQPGAGAVLGSRRRVPAGARREQPHRRLGRQPHVRRDVAPADRLPSGGGRGMGVPARRGRPRRACDLRRRRHVERALARGHQHVGDHAAAGGVGRQQQPVRVLDAQRTRVRGADDRGARERLRDPRGPRRRHRRAGGLRGHQRGGRSGAQRRRAHAHRVGLAAVARARRTRPGEVRPPRAPRALHAFEGPGEELRGVTCSNAASWTPRRSPRCRSASSRRSRRRMRSRSPRRSPRPAMSPRACGSRTATGAPSRAATAGRRRADGDPAGRGRGRRTRRRAARQALRRRPGHLPRRDRRGPVGGDGARRACLHARRGHRRLRWRVQGDRGLPRPLRVDARGRHPDRRGDHRGHGGRVRDGRAPARRRVPVRGLHVERVRRDHDGAVPLPLPRRRAAAGGACAGRAAAACAPRTSTR